MYRIKWLGRVGSTSYDTKADAWRAVHELLEEAFGDNYGDDELAEYAVTEI